MEDRVLEKVESKIRELIDQDINPNSLDHLYKLSKIRHMIKEDKNMYGYVNYNGRGPSRGAYGEGHSYGRTGDIRYRGEEELDRMAGEYGRYQESRSYGNAEESDKSFHYMIKSLEGFIRTIAEEAETPQQRQMLKEVLQRSMM